MTVRKDEKEATLSQAKSLEREDVTEEMKQ